MENKKSEIISSLEITLSNTAGIKYYCNPKSLFIIDNPDIIATCGNNIFGVYVPSAYELNNLDSLYRRIYLSRLVYAHDLRTILILPDEIGTEYKHNIKYACHRMAIGEEIDDVNKMIEGDHSNMKYKMLSRKVRKYAADNFYMYRMLLSEIDTRLSSFKMLVPTDNWQQVEPVLQWQNCVKQKSVQDAYILNNKVIFNRKRNSMSTSKNFEKIYNYALFSQFSWDKGQLYLSNKDNQIRGLNTDIVLKYGYDSIEFSTLIYLGILPMCVDSIEQFDQIVNKGFDLLENYGNKKG